VHLLSAGGWKKRKSSSEDTQKGGGQKSTVHPRGGKRGNQGFFTTGRGSPRCSPKEGGWLPAQNWEEVRFANREGNGETTGSYPEEKVTRMSKKRDDRYDSSGRTKRKGRQSVGPGFSTKYVDLKKKKKKKGTEGPLCFIERGKQLQFDFRPKKKKGRRREDDRGPNKDPLVQELISRRGKKEKVQTAFIEERKREG